LSSFHDSWFMCCRENPEFCPQMLSFPSMQLPAAAQST
jgi:hypothetical protein